MKILILTQAIDRHDPLLGFFHDWVAALAERAESVKVICLKIGNFDLPVNVEVSSLGKEQGVARRWIYIVRFWRLLWRQHGRYQTVFVHMTPVYVVLAAWWWKLWGVKIVLWYNHPRASWLDRLGLLLADRICYTSTNSYGAAYSQAKQMPVGINTEKFKFSPGLAQPPRLLALGRISAIKCLERLIEALPGIAAVQPEATVTIAGPVARGDEFYLESLKQLAGRTGVDAKIQWQGQVTPAQTLEVYHSHSLFVNFTPAGSLDKTIFEAMAAGLLVVTTNRSFAQDVPAEVRGFLFPEDDSSSSITKAIVTNLNLLPEDRRRLTSQYRELVINKHSLSNLIGQLLLEL